MAWTNADGLIQKFDNERVERALGGEHISYGLERQLVLEIDLTELTETESVIPGCENVQLPAGALISQVEIFTLVAAADGTAIDVGTIHPNLHTTTPLTADPNGILAAFVTATMSEVGEYTKFTKVTAMPAGTTTDGAQIGTVVSASYPVLFTASATDSTAFSAGRIKFVIHYIPRALADAEAL